MSDKDLIAPEWGDIGVSNEVFENIATICANKIIGVAGIESTEGLVDSLSKVWGRGDSAKGVKVSTESEAVSIDLTVLIEEGFPIPQVAESVQKEVKSMVEDMTGQSVHSINILIADLHPAAAHAEIIPPQ